MEEEEFDEALYNRVIVSGREDATATAAKAFSVLGFRKNQRLITGIALGSLDYSTERTFAALRCAHASRHISPVLPGRQSWLPLLHTVHIMRNYRQTGELQERRGGSLTSPQLHFELLECFDRGNWSRALGIAAEMVSRGDDDALLASLRSEATRRQSAGSNAYTVWNAMRCVAEHDSEILGQAVTTAIIALSGVEVSPSYAAARRYLAAERLNPEKLADNGEQPDEREEERLLEGIRSGLPEIVMQLLARELRQGIGPLPLLRLTGVESLNQSFNAPENRLFESHIESLSAVLEANSSQGQVSGRTVMELLIECIESTSLAGPVRYRRKKERTGKLERAAARIAKGSAADMIAHIDGLKNTFEIETATRLVILSSLRCDPDSTGDHPFVHCAASLNLGSNGTQPQGSKIALKECSDNIARLNRERKGCNNSIMNIIETGREDEIDDE